MYQDANMWMKKPTPVTTDNMVNDRPSSVRVTPILKLPTVIQFHRLCSNSCTPVAFWAKKSIATCTVTNAARPIEPTPMVAETFSDQRPREKANSRNPISGSRIVKYNRFIRASH
ncbi:hypothetical protein D3C76_1371960 [compost metagenome]